MIANNNMIEIAGVIISGVGLLNDLVSRYQDLTHWEEIDLQVDNNWLGLALEKGLIDGREDDYRWVAERKVASHVLRGTAELVMAFDDKTRRKYRVCRGRADDRLILMKRIRPAR